MSVDILDRSLIMGAVVGTAPQLTPWFDQMLNKQTYAVPELNTLFRYQVISLSPDNLVVRGWLDDTLSTVQWLYYFTQHVIPYIAHHLRGSYISPKVEQLMIGVTI